MFLRVYTNKTPSKSIDFRGFRSTNDMVPKNPAKRAGSRLGNPNPDPNDQLAVQQSIHTPTTGSNSETQDAGPQTPPETNQPGPETIVKGKGVVRQQPEGSPSRPRIASGGNDIDDDDHYHDQTIRYFTGRNSRGFPLMGDYNDDDNDLFDQHPSTMPSYAQKLEMERLQIEKEKLQIEKQKTRTQELELQVQLLQMQAQAVPTAPSESQPPDLVIDRTAAYNPDSAIGKQITVFLKQAKLVRMPIQLTGSANYATWKNPFS